MFHITTSRYELMIRGAAPWITMLLAVAVTHGALAETSHAFQLPIFQNVRWRPSTMRVLLENYQSKEPGKMEALEKTIHIAGDAILENDNEVYLSILDPISKSLMKPDMLNGDALKITRGPILAENGNVLSWKLREMIDTGKYVFAIMEFSLESSDPYLRQAAICLPFFWDADGWKMDCTSGSLPAKGVMEGIFCPANEAGLIAAGVVNSERGSDEIVLVSWPFGRENQGWKPIRLLGKGRPLGKDQETHPAIEVFKAQKSIVAKMKLDGFSKELGQKFLETLGEGFREYEADELEYRPDSFETDCEGMDLDLDPVYLIDGGESCILLTMPQVPMSEWERVPWFRRGEHEFFRENEAWKSTAYGATLKLTALYCSIDLRAAIEQDTARVKNTE